MHICMNAAFELDVCMQESDWHDDIKPGNALPLASLGAQHLLHVKLYTQCPCKISMAVSQHVHLHPHCQCKINQRP